MKPLQRRFLFVVAGLAMGMLLAATPASGQVVPCSTAEPTPPKLPPAGSPPLFRCVQLVFHPVNESVIDTSTYLYYLKAPRSLMSQEKWAPYDENAILADYMNLWKTNFLDNMWVEKVEEPYDNGVVGIHVIFHMEERARIKIVDYKAAAPDSKLQVEQSKIEEKLKEKGIEVRLDSFVDQSTIRRVTGVIKDLYGEKGYQAAKITPEMTEVATGSKLVHLTFTIAAGPKYQIRQVVFSGNKAFDSGKLAGQMKENRATSWLSFITDAGTYQEAKFADDAQRVVEFYQDEGYARAQVGQPQIETIQDSTDGKTRDIRLRIPVDEGQRYHIGKFEIASNVAIKTEYLRSIFALKEGDFFDAKAIRKGLEKTREGYGSIGYWEFTPDVELSYRGIDQATGKPIGPDPPPPIVDVTIRMQEGKQYFVNRLTFLGNTTTHDNVIRRELRLVEGGVFNNEALKYSIRRLNQLGYFKPLDNADAIQVEKTPGLDGRLDVRLKLQEQNRNQISFGAGVSQIDGFFGQVAFQTANFLGRGETLGISLQKGSQAKNYQVSFSEPYLFDRPITAGVDVYSRQFIFPSQYTQQSTGGNLVVGLPVSDWNRLYLGYSYEHVVVPLAGINPAYLTPAALTASPYLRDSLLLNEGGQRTVSKVSPSFVYNTVNAPIFPTSGKTLTAAFDFAGVGGDTDYVMSRLEGIWYIHLSTRTSLGLRAQGQYIRPYGSTTTLPIFEKLFLGGEYSVRGFDLRSVGPRDPASRLVTGGNKTLLFNLEYSINVGGPVRLLMFYDVGQVRDIGQSFGWKEPVIQTVIPPAPVLLDPAVLNTLSTGLPPQTIVTGQTDAFKSSTGMEIRFFMPVLNVPFRLIFAYNPQRLGVLDNNLLQTKRFTFKFAVGTTF